MCTNYFIIPPIYGFVSNFYCKYSVVEKWNNYKKSKYGCINKRNKTEAENLKVKILIKEMVCQFFVLWFEFSVSDISQMSNVKNIPH